MYKLESEEGFSGGLITWGIFVLLFALLGVPAVLCIVLGAVGGAAVWLMIAYWRAEKSDAPPKPADESDAIRPVRRLIQRFPGSAGLGRYFGAPQSITRDTSSGEGQKSRRDPTPRSKSLKRQPSSSLRDAIRRRKNQE